MSEKVILAGDIGGTNTKLAYFSSHQGSRTPFDLEILKNKDFKSFQELLDYYFELHSRDFVGICLGIAGPVIDNRVDITNLGWKIDGDTLKTKYDLQGVWLLNDLEALCYGVLQMEDEDLAVIRIGDPVQRAPMAVIAPGTGLGEGFLIWDGRNYQAVSTEGGHTDFGPTNHLQDQLVAYLHARDMRVSYERVCSGLGVPNLYSFLRDQGYAEEPDWLREEMEGAESITPFIFQNAGNAERECQLCDLTVDLFVSILGAEAGNLALKMLALGGIYIGGGIPPRILPWLEKKSFLEAVDDKDPHQDLMAEIPVHVIVNPIANLIGSACYGLREST
jgi:glucokinase